MPPSFMIYHFWHLNEIKSLSELVLLSRVVYMCQCTLRTFGLLNLKFRLSTAKLLIRVQVVKLTHHLAPHWEMDPLDATYCIIFTFNVKLEEREHAFT